MYEYLGKDLKRFLYYFIIYMVMLPYFITRERVTMLFHAYTPNYPCPNHDQFTSCLGRDVRNASELESSLTELWLIHRLTPVVRVEGTSSLRRVPAHDLAIWPCRDMSDDIPPEPIKRSLYSQCVVPNHPSKAVFFRSKSA